MDTVKRWVVVGRDAEHLFSSSGWSASLVESPEFESREAAERFATLLVEETGWSAKDIRIETRYRPGLAKAEDIPAAKRSAS